MITAVCDSKAHFQMTLPSRTPPPMRTAKGRRGSYHWLSKDGYCLTELLRGSPDTVLGKYLAVTSHDSGSLPLTEQQRSCGWTCRGGIAYSPRIESLEMVPTHGLYDEWYIFDSPADLGVIREGNIFDCSVSPQHVEVFVNFYGFAIDAPEFQELVSRFWQQLEWIRPITYVAEGDFGFLTFVTADNILFTAVCKALGGSASEADTLSQR